MSLSAAAQTSLAKWRAMVANNDYADLSSIIAIDAIFHSPVEWHPYPGRDLVCLLVRAAAEVFEDFKYLREFIGTDCVALEFSAHIGEVELRAVHLIRFNAAGEFADIDKVMRPAEGVKALGHAMGLKIGPQAKAALDALKQPDRNAQPKDAPEFAGN